MSAKQVKTESFTPFFKITDQARFKALYTIITVFGLSGCATSQKVSPLAPSPPELRFSSLYHEDQSTEISSYLSQSKAKNMKEISSHVALLEAIRPVILKEISAGFKKKKYDGDKCKIQHRFDREAVLAYEWGKNRIAFDVDGFNVGGSGDNQSFKLSYRLRLQPEKTKREKCRFSSSWQGLIGSGYNEFFIREKNTIYQELKEYKLKMNAYLDNAF